MSKIFDELERLENASKQVPALRPESTVTPGIQPAPSNVIVKAPAVKREQLAYGLRPAELRREPPGRAEEPAKGHPLQAIAFDVSMILLALAIFAGICVALGSANVLDLTRNAPLLAIVPISLVSLYLLLPRILRRGTPGVAGNGETAVAYDPSPARNRKVMGTLGQLTVPPGSLRPAPALRRPLLEDLALAARILAAEGVLDVAGSLSVRDDSNPARIYMAGNEISEYDLNGNRLGGDSSQAHPDRFVHSEVYRARPDVMAIVVSQAPELIPFAASSVPMLPIIEFADFLVGGVPVFESRSVGPVSDPVMRSRAIAQAIAETLAERAAILVRGRGAVVVGPSLRATVGRAYYTNMNARLQAQSILLGGSVNYLEPSDTSAPAAEFEHAWEYWKQKSAL